MKPSVVELDVSGLRQHARPYCTHVRVEAPNTHNQRDEVCKRKAAWLVDGVKLCTHHGGLRVLQALMSGKVAA